jgi:hypothetical protein
LADYPRHNGHQPDSVQRWEIYSIADERNLPPQSAQGEKTDGRLLMQRNTGYNFCVGMMERWNIPIFYIVEAYD